MTASAAITRLRAAISFCSGDGGSAVVWVRWAIFPNAVCIPVAKTSACRFAARHGRAGQQHVAAPQQVRFVEGRASRDTGRASPVTVALLTRTPNAFDQPAVGGHVIPGASGRSRRRARPPRTGARRWSRSAGLDLVRKQTLQRGHRLFGAILLPERKGAVDRDHGNDRGRERPHALTRHPPRRRSSARSGRDPQQGGEEVGELAEEANGERGAREALDAVGPELEPSRGGVCSGQAGRATPQGCERGVQGELRESASWATGERAPRSQRIRKSTSIVTSTLTGVAPSRPGSNRHWATAARAS